MERDIWILPLFHPRLDYSFRFENMSVLIGLAFRSYSVLFKGRKSSGNRIYVGALDGV